MKLDLYHFMSLALKEAKDGLKQGEVPVGAVLVGADGMILASAHNMPRTLNDPTAHAEILAIREAARRVGNYRLTDTTLVVTIEPCPMCMGAVLHSRIGHLVYGAADPKAGSAGSVFDLSCDRRLNHAVKVTSGVMEAECRSLIQEFFGNKRKKKE